MTAHVPFASVLFPNALHVTVFGYSTFVTVYSQFPLLTLSPTFACCGADVVVGDPPPPGVTVVGALPLASTPTTMTKSSRVPHPMPSFLTTTFLPTRKRLEHRGL